MGKKINCDTNSTETFKAKTWLYQKIDSINGIGEKEYNQLNFTKREILTLSELRSINILKENELYGEYVMALMLGTIQEDGEEIIKPLIDFINSKRVFRFLDKDGNKKAVGIPSYRTIPTRGLCSYSKLLLGCATRYNDYASALEDEKDEKYKAFENAVFKLQKEIATRIVTKSIKEKSQFKFNGISGIVLTGNCGIDEVELPIAYARENNIGIGHLCLIERDPNQNIFIALKVSGYTANEIRINPQACTFLGGDFDGDRINVIPAGAIIKECKRHNISEKLIKQILFELSEIIPSKLFDNPKYERLLRDYEFINN